jgi:lipoprotein-anchoring transpeptidase ErfK/SrfK
MNPKRKLVAAVLVASLAMVSATSCRQQAKPMELKEARLVHSDTVQPKPVEAPPPATQYYFVSLRNKDKGVRDSAEAIFKSFTPGQKAVVLKLNRVDAASYKRLDTIIVPEQIDTNWLAYCIFPTELPLLKDVRKMVFFAYYPQAFAAYENGKLILWGPTNMGKKATPTPTGLFSANWKALESVSTVDDEWVLKWNFNVWNKGGVGWHQYQLPGYPASHSCMRLLEEDAKYLYTWADMWVLRNGQLAAQGTPVLIFGAYPFGKGKPWWQLVGNNAALNIPADSINAMVQPHLEKILQRQAQRDSLQAPSAPSAM